MRIIIVGCGRLGAELAFRLFKHNHQVVVIDKYAGSFQNLHHEFRGRTLEGDGVNQGVLVRGGIQDADSLAAVTSSDVANAVIGHIARAEFEVDRIVVRNYDARWQEMHEVFRQQTVSSTLWGVERVEELLKHSPLRLVYSTSTQDLQIFDLTVPHAYQGKSILDLFPNNTCDVISHFRKGQNLPIDCKRPMMTGDILHLSTQSEGAKVLRSVFNIPDAPQ